MPAAAQADDVRSLRTLPGVGSRTEERLQRLGIRTLADLLFHLPFRYEDRTRLVPIGALRPGQEALIQGEIELAQVRFGRRRSLLCRISDGTGALVMRLFHFNRGQEAALARGRKVRCWGQVRRGPQSLEMIHPEYQLLQGDDAEPALDEALTPVYPGTEGLTQGLLRRLCAHALEALDANPAILEELIPEKTLAGLRLPPLREALRLVHRPPPDVDREQLMSGRHPAQRRLAFEELLAHQVSLKLLRREVRALKAAPLDGGPDVRAQFAAALPFKLTRAQERVVGEVLQDLAAPVPMLRLVQGDVGCGKTVVAAFAAVQCARAGFQAAVMAPTELLAEQHHANLTAWLEPMGIAVCLVTGRQRRGERTKILERLAGGEPIVAVGTHALFQQEMRFSRLGLVVIDEQHRFGVHQRLALLEKGVSGSLCPHQLIMTATPIPRTLAMTMFADLDISIVDELPPGRRPVRTLVLANSRRAEVIERIRHACAGGRQVYWVCPLIDESEDLQCEAAVETQKTLEKLLPGRAVGLMHGRLKAADKEQAMRAFRAGETDVLVATTVIEVGVDVPNASLMIIENAERLGLSQLHQLRGRVGRGRRDSDCVLLYQAPLGETARQRLETMRRTSDGFAIAEKDLELRGPGELLGARQTGLPAMRVANLVRDARLIPQVQRAAEGLLQHHPEICTRLVQRWITVEAAVSAV